MTTASPTVIFDLDGTLIDSAHAILACLRDACDATSTARPASSVEREVLGVPITDVLPRYMTQATADRVWAAFLEMYSERSVAEARLFPGVADLLAELAQRCIPTAVATNKLEKLAVRILEEVGVGDSFCTVVGRDEGGTRLTKATVIAEARRRLDEPPRCVKVGDRAADVEAARSAGIPFLGAGWGYAEEGELRSAGAAVVLVEPSEVIAWLDDLPAPPA